MIEVLFEHNRDMYLEYFRLSKKDLLKRRLKVMLVMFFLFGIVLYFYNNSVYMWLLLPVFLFIGYKVPYYELLRIKDKEDIIRELMFPTFLRYFISLIGTQGNVYQTIKASIPHVQEPIRTELIKLLKKLDDEEVANYQAFMDFADYVGSPEAYMIMGVINQFDEDGVSKNDLAQLELTVKNLQENKMNEALEMRVNAIEKHADPILVYGLAYVVVFTFTLFMAMLNNLDF